MLDEYAQLAISRGLKEGSRDAWATLYDGYSVELWRYVARLVGPNSASVADIVQEAFLEAARSARQFNSDRGTLWNWLCGIAHHRTTAYWREANRARRLQQLVEERGASFCGALDEGEAFRQLSQQHELAEVVRYALSELASEYSALLTAKYCDERSLDELAQQAGVSTDAVKSKLARARREFRSAFERINSSASAPVR